ncbi:hypothetical protein [Haematobacter sp.]|uniref:hypothetical protein n=1 Tax=Haematobacter sp. TaxID=2953762 RepID=UPI003918085D
MLSGSERGLGRLSFLDRIDALTDFVLCLTSAIPGLRERNPETPLALSHGGGFRRPSEEATNVHRSV